MTQANRKRGRSADEEVSEFAPLSKRINNLHINGLSGLQETPAGGEYSKVDWRSQNFVPSPNHSEPSQGSSSCDGYPSSSSTFSAEYRPDLDVNENPFYYENNKLLYSLYVERMQRHPNLNELQ